MLTGEVVGGEQALRERLVASLDEDAEAAAVEVAAQMAAQAPAAVRSCVIWIASSWKKLVCQ